MRKLYNFIVYDKNKTKILEYKNISYNYIEKFLDTYYNNTFLKYCYTYEIKEVNEK